MQSANVLTDALRAGGPQAAPRRGEDFVRRLQRGEAHHRTQKASVRRQGQQPFCRIHHGPLQELSQCGASASHIAALAHSARGRGPSQVPQSGQEPGGMGGRPLARRRLRG